MQAAIVGLVGVLLGALLSYSFTTSHEWRAKRLEALVDVVGAAGRVIGAHERLHEILSSGGSPLASEPRMSAALAERSESHADWRRAYARAGILVLDDRRIESILSDFDQARASATSSWVGAYISQQQEFDFAQFAEVQEVLWRKMRDARRDLITASRRRVYLDMRWYARYLRAKKIAIASA